MTTATASPRLRALIASLIAAATTTATAQDAATTPITELEEVIVTATPLRTTVMETAQPVWVLSGEALQRDLATNLGDTLANRPGLSATSFGPIASRPIIRGQGGLRVQVYQDMAEALDVAALSEDHATTVDPMVAERIEVLRGPAALMFGSASAAGAINVVTSRLPIAALDRPSSYRLELRGDSANDERGIAMRGAGELGSGWQWSADAQSKRSDDLRTAIGRLENTAGEAEAGALGLGWRGEQLAFGMSLSGYRNNYGLPEGAHGHGGHDDDHEDDHDDDHHDDEGHDHGDVYLDLEQLRVDAIGEWRPGQGAIERLTLRYARNDYEHTEWEGDDPATRYAQIGDELRLAAEYVQGSNGRGVLGLHQRELDFTAVGEEAFLPSSTTRSLGIFAFQEYRAGPLLLEAGARWERQRLDTRGDHDDRYRDDAWSGSAGAVWTLDPSLRLAFQLTATQRHPTATELFADGPHLAVRRYEIGNAELGVETAHTADLGLRFVSRNGRARGQLSFFVSDYDDYIYPALLGDDAHDHDHDHDHDHGDDHGHDHDELSKVAYRATDARFHGVEAEWSLKQLVQFAGGRFDARIFGDYVRARSASGEPLPLIPPLRLGGELSWNRAGLRLGVEALWHAAQTRLAENETRTDGYTLLQVDLSYRHTLGKAAMLWFLRGSNLLDEDARRHASPLKDAVPLAGRAARAGLRLEF